MKRTHRRQNCAQMPGTTASRDPLPLIDRYIVRKRRRSHSYFRLSQPPPSTTFLITLATISSALFLPFQSDQATNSQLALAFQTPRTRDEYFRAATPNHKSQQMLQNEATNKGIEFNGRESRYLKGLFSGRQDFRPTLLLASRFLIGH